MMMLTSRVVIVYRSYQIIIKEEADKCKPTV